MEDLITMDSINQESSLNTLDSKVENVQPKICPKCGQSYVFIDECPICFKEITEASEKFILSVRIKDILDNINISDFYEESLEKLKQLDKIITSIYEERK